VSNGRRFVSDNGQVLLLAFDTATPAVTVALRGDEGVLAEHTEIDARRHGELLAPGIEKVLADAGRSRTDLTGIAVGVGPGPFTGLRVGLVTARALGDALDIPVHGVCTLDILAAAVVVPGIDPQSPANDADIAGNADIAGITDAADTVAAGANDAAGVTSATSASSVKRVSAVSAAAAAAIAAGAGAAAGASAGFGGRGGGDFAAGGDRRVEAVFAAAGGRFAVATDARRREVYWAVYDLAGRRETDPAVDRPADIAERLAELAVAGQGPLLYPDQFPYALSPALPSAAVLAELVARRLREAPEALLPPIPLYLRRPDAVEPGARKSVTPA
jgi:tRNA threonylcarbamoyl adenosine modification protein YeaZ